MDQNHCSLWDRATQIVIVSCGVALSLFQMYTARFGVLDGSRQAATHLLFVMVIGFLCFPAGKRVPRVTDRIFSVLLMLGAVLSLFFLIADNTRILKRMQLVTPVTDVEFVMGFLLVIAVLELARRTLGLALPVIAMIFAAYAFFGPEFGGILYHKGVTARRFIEQMYLMFNGIFGEALTVSATFVFLFILFGSFLEASGGGEFFMDVSKSLVGRMRGGPGLMAVVSSSLMGTISGSAVANVVTTGVFTIPLMKKSGYEKNFAGAVEAVASTGGQILPPIMGSGAFIMSEYIGIPYAKIAICAAVPALLYYFAVFMQVYFEARRSNLTGIPSEEIQPLREVLRSGGHLSIPLIMIVYFMLTGYSPMRAGFYGVISVVAVTSIKRSTRMDLRKIVSAMVVTGRSVVPVASACACAGIIIGVVRFTGIGLKFSSAVLSISGGNLLIGLFMCMCASLVLGMGLPTAAAYILQAALAAPALVSLGLSPIQAHLFIFYFSCIAVITPPVALAAYAAAPICDGNAVTVGVKAFRLGLAAFIVPYLFAYGPGLLLIGSLGEIAICVITAIVGILLLSVSLTGWAWGRLHIVSRALFFLASMLLMIQGGTTDFIGVLLLAAGVVCHVLDLRRSEVAGS